MHQQAAHPAVAQMPHYAIWSAVVTALIATIGILWFKEPISVLKIGFLALIILGVIGLNRGVGH